MSAPAGFRCPECGEPPRAVLDGGRQAFCFNMECRVFTWDPARTPEELKVIDLSVLDGPDDEGARPPRPPSG